MIKIIRYTKRRIMPGAGFIHADERGHSVLRGQSSWRTISGVYLNTYRTGFVCLEFRRHAPS